ncbi:hypothetical protein ABPG75_006776 [Micractinium tetrahymenae]
MLRGELHWLADMIDRCHDLAAVRLKALLEDMGAAGHPDQLWAVLCTTDPEVFQEAAGYLLALLRKGELSSMHSSSSATAAAPSLPTALQADGFEQHAGVATQLATNLLCFSVTAMYNSCRLQHLGSKCMVDSR